MFAKKGTVVRTGPDPDEVRPDSPRWHSNRNPDGNAQDIDRALRQLGGKRLVRDPQGNTFAVVAQFGIKPDWTDLGPAPECGVTHRLWAVPPKLGPGGCELTAASVGRLPVSQSHVAESKGWTLIGDCMRGRDPRESLSAEHLEHHRLQIEFNAHTLRTGEYRTGRIIAADGEVWRETTNDDDIVARVHPRGATTINVTDTTKKGTDQ